MQNVARTLLLALLLTLTTGCVFPGVYRIDVQQGNIVEAETFAQLQPGMTRRQVQFLLGRPVASNSFDNTIDTYVYTMQLEGREIHEQRIDLHYEDDTLVKIDATPLLRPELANPGLVYKLRQEGEPEADTDTDTTTESGND